jgi:hypothetical protein
LILFFSRFLDQLGLIGWNNHMPPIVFQAVAPDIAGRAVFGIKVERPVFKGGLL